MQAKAALRRSLSRLRYGLERPALALVLLSLLWGSEWMLNGTLNDQPRLRLMALRCLVAAVALLPFAARRMGRVAVGRNCLLGLGLFTAPVFLSSLAPDISPGLAILLFATTPLLATLFENRGGIPGGPWMLGGMMGTAFLVRGALSFSTEQGWTVLWIFLAVLSVAASMVKARAWMAGQPLAAAFAVQMTAAAVALGTASLLRREAPGPWTLAGAMALMALALCAGAGGYLLFYRLLHEFRASQLAVLQWLVPAVAVAESALWVRHLPAWDSTAGGLAAALCAILMLSVDADSSTHG